MNRITTLLLFAVTLLGQQPERRLVLISVDGLMPSTVQNAEKLGLKIPNLLEFRDKGAFAEGLRGVFPTVTYPSHTTIVTGRDPAEHGIISNQQFDPERRLDGAWFYYAEQIRTPTLWDVAKAAGMSTAGVSWPVTVGARIDFNIPEYRPARTEENRMLSRALATPGLFSEFEQSAGIVPVNEDDSWRSREAAFLIKTRRPQLVLLHVFDLDEAQHEHGPGSPESLAKLEKIDQHIGLLRKTVADAGLSDSTRWIVTSDHGFYAVNKTFHPQAFLASLGLAASEGDPSSWRVAAHSAGGSVAFVAKNAEDSGVQLQVLRTLEKLRTEGDWGIDLVFNRAELDEMNASPHAFAAVSLESNFSSGSNRTGPWVTSSGSLRGTHGFAPGPAALDTTFIAFGPGIPPQRLPRGDLRDVGKTAAALLGIEFPTARGKDLLRPQR